MVPNLRTQRTNKRLISKLEKKKLPLGLWFDAKGSIKKNVRQADIIGPQVTVAWGSMSSNPPRIQAKNNGFIGYQSNYRVNVAPSSATNVD